MIGKRLAEIRDIKDDTQQDLADKLNVSVSTVRSWEQGKSSPSHELLVAICKEYKVSSDYLLGLSDDYTNGKSNTEYRLSQEELLDLQEYEAFIAWKRERQKRSTTK